MGSPCRKEGQEDDGEAGQELFGEGREKRIPEGGGSGGSGGNGRLSGERRCWNCGLHFLGVQEWARGSGFGGSEDGGDAFGGCDFGFRDGNEDFRCLATAFNWVRISELHPAKGWV